MMRWFLILGAALAPAAASAFFIEGDYDASNVAIGEFNQNRAAQLWNNSAAPMGTLRNPTSYGLSVGGRFLFHTRLSVRFDNQVQTGAQTTIDAQTTMTDQLVYRPLYLMLELPMFFGAWSISFGGGVGYALNFEYHQRLSGAQSEDITWQGHPIGARGRVAIAYRLSPMLVLVGEGYYEHVAGFMKAAKDYSTSVSGQAVTQGDDFVDNQGQPVRVDMSGAHFGGGLRLTF